MGFYLVQAHCNLHSHDVIVISGMRGMPLFGGLFFDKKREHWKSECIYIYVRKSYGQGQVLQIHLK